MVFNDVFKMVFDDASNEVFKVVFDVVLDVVFKMVFDVVLDEVLWFSTVFVLFRVESLFDRPKTLRLYIHKSKLQESYFCVQYHCSHTELLTPLIWGCLCHNKVEEDGSIRVHDNRRRRNPNLWSQW